MASAGLFNEHLNIDKAVTIQGANVGVDGGSVRGAGTDIMGGVTIGATGVTLDGVKIAGSYDSVAQDGTDVPNGVLVKGADATIQNSVFIGDALDSTSVQRRRIGHRPERVSHNIFLGWSEGAYLVEGSSGSRDRQRLHQ